MAIVGENGAAGAGTARGTSWYGTSVGVVRFDGLCLTFNEQITRENRHRILVFTHDDVRIDDY